MYALSTVVLRRLESIKRPSPSKKPTIKAHIDGWQCRKIKERKRGNEMKFSDPSLPPPPLAPPLRLVLSDQCAAQWPPCSCTCGQRGCRGCCPRPRPARAVSRRRCCRNPRTRAKDRGRRCCWYCKGSPGGRAGGLAGAGAATHRRRRASGGAAS